MGVYQLPQPPYIAVFGELSPGFGELPSLDGDCFVVKSKHARIESGNG